MRPRASLAAAVVAVVAVVAACGDGAGEGAALGSGPAGSPGDTATADGGGAEGASGAEPAPAPAPSEAGPSGPSTTAPAPAVTDPPAPQPAGPPALTLTPVATLDAPVAMAVRAGDAALYVAEKGGRVRALRGGAVDPTPVLDLGGQVSGAFEQGLLGLAFSPDGGRLYVHYTDGAGDTRVVEYAMAGAVADAGSARTLLAVDQPYVNHNGGQLVVRPDGTLWIALGDGGSGGDPHDNAQSLGTLLGKILRIDPTPSGTQPYTVPAANPFVGRDGARGEIWAYGLRNPWRFSFDRSTGDLWIGDVGQNAREEIDLVPGGAASGGGHNFGWARVEGTRPFSGAAPAGAVAPIYDYPRSGSDCSVTGGYVYRGSRIPALVGTYVFADFCTGQLRGLRQSGGALVAEETFDARARFVSSFGQDQAGELYVLSLEGPVYRIDPA